MALLEEIAPSEIETLSGRLFRTLRRVLNLVAIYGMLLLAMEPTHHSVEWYFRLKVFSVAPIYAAYLIHLALAVLISKSLYGFVRFHAVDLVFFVPLFTLTFGGVHPAHILMVRQVVYYFSRYLRRGTLTNFAESISEHPARLISWSFAGVILVGSFLLVLPVSVASDFKPSFLTALFTSTSAVCVTGLVVVDTPTYFTAFGQLVILGLIQIGGLGIMTLSAGVSMLVGKRMGLSERSLLQNVLDATDLTSLRGTLRDILGWTILIEVTGALILGVRFHMILGGSISQAVYLGIFHSVSAFCNAGFALFSDSLMGFSWDPVINLTICALITLGGLGFVVLATLNAYLLGRKKTPIDVHSLLAVVTSIILSLGGAALILALESNSPAMAHLNFPEKILAAFFQSVTCRTAGFNTIDIGMMRAGSLFFMVFLMFVGASPGSTGGGIKTTTFATLLIALDTQMKGLSEIVIRERTIPRDTVLKAFLITGISVGLVTLYTFLLLLTEDQPLTQILFEVVSAFGTVGLSANLTPQLSSIGRLLIISMMFIGRVGPLTLALTVRKPPSGGEIGYPTGRVLVG